MTGNQQQSEPGKPSPQWQRIGRKADEILNIRGEIERQRTWQSTLVERIGYFLARPAFFLVLLAVHLLWILLNIRIFPWFEPWDPYPFTFAATFASLEAPFIALLILMHQQRNARIEELREETHLQVSLHIEREITMALRLLAEVQEGTGRQSQQDAELLASMKEDLDPSRLMENLRRDLQQVEDDSGSIAP
jgi:uncharacterized membrane protein